MANSQVRKVTKRTFPGISARTWEHPADTAALLALQKIPSLDAILTKYVGATTERSLRLMSLASAVRVSARQFPRLHEMLLEACRIMDWPVIPEFYVAQNPVLNAGAMGVERPFITITSSALGMLDDQELLTVIGHELGHVMSGHVLYKTLLTMLVKTSLDVLPALRLAIGLVIAGLREWDRRSEMSADRAGLLVGQNIESSFSALMKTAGGSYSQEMSVEEFLLQAQEYEAGGDLVDGVYKLMNQMDESHPFAVVRLAQLKSWHDSGAYDRILAGDYRRRGTERDESVKDAFNRAAGSYSDDLGRSKDPLAGSVRDLKENLENAAADIGKQAEEVFKGLFGGGKRGEPQRGEPEDRTPKE